ncbi:MAG: ADP-ribosylglycohydrolase family protein [Bacteroidota bacterium]
MKNMISQRFHLLSASLLLIIGSCSSETEIKPNPHLNYKSYSSKPSDLLIDRESYYKKLQGYWLGTCIGNWTGLVTEMDKIGNIGEVKTGDFYTRNDWGKPDQPSIWGEGVPSDLSDNIDFVFADTDSVWGADDDTDIEYIYQELLIKHQTSMLTGEQIREGWLRHIRHEEENYLWVSNQKALDLMKEGFTPPATGDPKNNPDYEMIDAQLTTEIFGLFAPSRPEIALQMAKLPVQTTARENSQWISGFYIAMFSLASSVDETLPMKEQIFWMAEQAKKFLPETSYAFKMYDFVKAKYEEGIPWEQARDSVYYRYQVEQKDGYHMTSQNRYCNGCFAAGINFAASLVSLFYGEGDFIETVKIGTLAGWDSDNPTATWAGLIGFMIGKEGIEATFNRTFSNRFNIHRTRVGFENNGIDSFDNMALKGIWIIDRVVQEEMNGGVNLEQNQWAIPNPA